MTLDSDELNKITIWTNNLNIVGKDTFTDMAKTFEVQLVRKAISDQLELKSTGPGRLLLVQCEKNVEMCENPSKCVKKNVEMCENPSKCVKNRRSTGPEGVKNNRPCIDFIGRRPKDRQFRHVCL